MDISIIEKAVELKRKLDHVRKAISKLNGDICIQLGGSFRLDDCAGVHDRVKESMLDKLNIIEQETLTELENL